MEVLGKGGKWVLSERGWLCVVVEVWKGGGGVRGRERGRVLEA